MYFSRKFYIYPMNWMNNADSRIYIYIYIYYKYFFIRMVMRISHGNLTSIWKSFEQYGYICSAEVLYR